MRAEVPCGEEPGGVKAATSHPLSASPHTSPSQLPALTADGGRDAASDEAGEQGSAAAAQGGGGRHGTPSASPAAPSVAPAQEKGSEQQRASGAGLPPLEGRRSDVDMQEGVLGPKEEAGSMQRVDRPLDAADAGLAGPCHGRLTSGEEGTRTSPEGRQARETCRAMSSQMSSAHTSAHAAGLLDVGAESGLAGEKGEKPGQRAPGTSDSTEQFGAPAPRPAAAAATHKLSQEASAGSRPAAQAAARGLSARARHGLDSKGSGASACKVQRVSSVPSRYPVLRLVCRPLVAFGALQCVCNACAMRVQRVWSQGPPVDTSVGPGAQGQ